MKTVVGATLRERLHAAGVMDFLRLAEATGWRPVFLGPAVGVEEVLAATHQEKANLVGVSYQLTPETGERLLGEFAEAADDLRTGGVLLAFGGTPPVAERALAFPRPTPTSPVRSDLTCATRRLQGSIPATPAEPSSSRT